MIETRLLEYFLAIAREQSFTRAADFLHVSQPTLSKQMMGLEDQVGKALFVRGGRRVTLTEEGMFLREKAQDIMSLMEQAESGLMGDGEALSGDIAIGCGETALMARLAGVIGWMRKRHPQVRFHIYSGAAESVLGRLDKGLLDFCMVFGPERQDRYDYMPLGWRDQFGVLMRRDDPLSTRETITLEDLEGAPLIVPGQTSNRRMFSRCNMEVAATYELIYNATFLVEQGVGRLLCLGGLVDEQSGRSLAFRALSPSVEDEWFLATKKYQTFSPAARAFLNRVRAETQGGGQ